MERDVRGARVPALAARPHADRPQHDSADFPAIRQRLQQRGCPVLPVTDDEGRLVGLFTMENIGEMLMVRNAISQSRRGR